MGRRILVAACLLAGLFVAGCKSDDVYVPRARTPGVAGEPPEPAPPR